MNEIRRREPTNYVEALGIYERLQTDHGQGLRSIMEFIDHRNAMRGYKPRWRPKLRLDGVWCKICLEID